MKFDSNLIASGLLASTTSSTALALKPRQQQAKTQVSQSLYDTLIYYAKYAPSYSKAPCQIPPSGTVVQGYANAAPTTEMTLFRSDADKELVMAFPGTADVQDLFTDVSISLVPYTTPGVNCPDCRVHLGVLNAWNAIAPQAKSVLDKALSAYPDYKFILVGHSLGGALTKMAYASFASQGYDVAAAFSYGEFRVGNPAFADFVDQLSGNTDDNQGPYHRVTHANDGVPQILSALQGYRHSRTEYWFSRGADGPTTTFRCYGQEPGDCNNSQLGIGLFGINAAHLSYPGINLIGCGGFP